MFIKRKQRGYGWYAKVVTKDMGGNELTDYINFTFKRGTEPINLNDYGAYEGELIFRNRDGSERRIFPIVKSYNDKTFIDFMLLEEQPPIELKGYSNAPTGLREYDEKTKIEMEELPFY